MDYEKLKAEIKEIAAVAESVPEPLRARCFEVLLEHLLSSEHGRRVPDKQKELEPERKEREKDKDKPLSLPAQVRVLLRRTDLAEEDLRKVVEVIDGKAHVIREPAPDNVAAGQIQWALMLALKNGLEGKDLVVDPEDVRSACIEKGFYDKANFARNFKTKQAYFKGALESQGEPQTLSSAGEKELANLVKELAGSG